MCSNNLIIFEKENYKINLSCDFERIKKNWKKKSSNIKNGFIYFDEERIYNNLFWKSINELNIIKVYINIILFLISYLYICI